MTTGKQDKNGVIIPMPDGYYPVPEILPPDRHPRLLIAENGLTELREKMKKPVYRYAVREYEKLRSADPDAEIASDAAKSGIALAVIESKAYSYVLTGNREDGRDAFRMLSHYFTVASFEGLADDYRFMGQTMFTAAEVYDWCYNLLSEGERAEIVETVENRIAPHMEIGMPPCRYGVIAGHQAEAQLLRDWLSFAVATYDEYPDIYRFVAGRFFYQYVPARNFWYRSGAAINGTSYGGYRFTWDLWSAWIFKRMNGAQVYSDDMEKIPAQWLQFRRPDGQGLRDGDDYAEFGGRWDQYGFPWFYAGNLFRNPVYRKQSFQKIGNRDRFYYTELTLTPVQCLLFDDDTVGEENFEDDYPLVRHYPDPYGVTVARTGFDISPESRDVMVLMKIGGLWTANHHHMDFGHFQLYYRGILASDSGGYIQYGSPQDMNYNKQTVAHNCILVYKPGETNGRAVNSGGQLMVPGEVLDLHRWLADRRFRMAEILSHDENPTCTVLAGDLTAAYGSKVKRATRRMVFLPLRDGEIRAVMMVFDRVTAACASYRKTSLLHCQEEPEIDGTTVTVRRTKKVKTGFGMETQYNGMLVSQMLLPRDAEVKKIGGAGHEFTVNGVNYPLAVTGRTWECAETGWGRIEVTPGSANLTDDFLNVMYVRDSGNYPVEKAVLTDQERFYGVSVLTEAVFFPKEDTPEKGSVTLSTANPTHAHLRWHVTGLAGGVWTVWDGDREILHAYVSAESGVLNFNSDRSVLRFTRTRS